MNNLKILINIILVILTACTDKHNDINYYYINNKQISTYQFAGFENELKNGLNELFRIVHLSDAHVSSWSSNNRIPIPGNLLEAVNFANDIEADVIVETGDHIGNKHNTSKEEAIRYLEVFANTLYGNNKIPTFTCTGNHDANMMNPDLYNCSLNKNDIYKHLTSRTNFKIHTSGTENYYYADVNNPRGGYIRIIALDVIDQEGIKYDAQHYAVISQKQIDWLCETALKENMTDRHSVIVLFHYPLPSNNEFIKDYEDQFLYNWTLIPEIIEAFRIKKSISCVFKDKKNGLENLYINTSFEDVPGEFICYFGGHIHHYLCYEIDGFNGLEASLTKQKMIIANNMSPSDKNPKSPIQRHREGLINNTFNIYAIDTESKTIHITFFGATAFYFPQIITLKYG